MKEHPIWNRKNSLEYEQNVIRSFYLKINKIFGIECNVSVILYYYSYILYYYPYLSVSQNCCSKVSKCFLKYMNNKNKFVVIMEQILKLNQIITREIIKLGIYKILLRC